MWSELHQAREAAGASKATVQAAKQSSAAARKVSGVYSPDSKVLLLLLYLFPPPHTPNTP